MVTGTPHRGSPFIRWTAHTLRTHERNIERWERLILTAFVVTSIVYAARAAHLLEGMETRWLDIMADADRPRFEAPITVVTIDDAAYHDPSLFGGLSPLDPGALARLLERTLDHRPRGVILDVQIHPAAHETPERESARLRLYKMLDSTSVAAGPPIVLVRDLEAESRERAANNTIRREWDRLTSSAGLIWADPTIVRTGGFVRVLPHYQRLADGRNSSMPTILGAAITAFGLAPHRSVPGWVDEGDQPTSPWRIRFTGVFLEDSSAVTPNRADARALLSVPVVGGQRSLLTDRIVLIGGTYYAGRDVHPTAVGGMTGVYIWAEALASWLREDALREPRVPIAFALEFLIGVVAGLLLVRFGPAFGLLYSLLVVGPLAIASSLLTFGGRVLFVSFLPSFVGVYLHYQFEVHREILDLRRRLCRAEAVEAKEIVPRDEDRHDRLP